MYPQRTQAVLLQLPLTLSPRYCVILLIGIYRMCVISSQQGRPCSAIDTVFVLQSTLVSFLKTMDTLFCDVISALTGAVGRQYYLCCTPY